MPTIAAHWTMPFVTVIMGASFARPCRHGLRWCILHGSFPYHKIFVRALMNAQEQYRSDRSKFTKRHAVPDRAYDFNAKIVKMVYAKPFVLDYVTEVVFTW